MKLIHRVCPVCGSSNYNEVLTLKQADFTTSNPTYRLDRLFELALDTEQLYPIVKCSQCRMIYSLYHLDDETESLVYNRIIDPDASLDKVLTVSRRIKDLQCWLGILSLVNQAQPGKMDLKLMDYGCGWGTLLLTARGPGVQVVGFDVTGFKVNWARSQGITMCTSVQDLMTYAPFDVVISTSVLEHLRSPREVMKEMIGMLKPGGYALISCIVPTAAQDVDWNEIKWRVSHGLPLHKEINPWEHLNYFTVETLSNLLSEFGLTPVSIKTHSDILERIIQGIWHMAKYCCNGIQILVQGREFNQIRWLPVPKIPEYWQLNNFKIRNSCE